MDARSPFVKSQAASLLCWVISDRSPLCDCIPAKQRGHGLAPDKIRSHIPDRPVLLDVIRIDVDAAAGTGRHLDLSILDSQ